MAKLLWIIACQRAIVDRENGTITLVDVVENVNIPAPPPEIAAKKPLVPFRFAVVTQWERSDFDKSETLEGRVRLLTPSGKRYGESIFSLMIQQRRAQIITAAHGFRYTGPGAYSVRVELNISGKWRKVGSTSFQVNLQEPSAKSH